METISAFPVVDFSAFSLRHKTRPSSSNADVKELGRNMVQALSSLGFVYLKNHGVPVSEIDEVKQRAGEFFQLDVSVKSKYPREEGTQLNGWTRMEAQIVDPGTPGDLKETFDISSMDGEWPDEVAPKLKPACLKLFSDLEPLGRRALSAIAIGLDLDPDVFEAFFTNILQPGGLSAFRVNYYPQLPTGFPVKPGQMRLGKHSDYGAITLLMLDDVPGLEVQNTEGEFIPAPYIEGTILLLMGTFMPRWTADRIKSSVHRVVLPTQEAHRQKSRRSMVYFFNPREDFVLQCLDGSDKYPPVNAADFFYQFERDSYGIEGEYKA